MFCLQIMRFDVTTIPVGQTAQPFTLDRQVLLNNALIAEWARVRPIGAVTTAARQVRQGLKSIGLLNPQQPVLEQHCGVGWSSTVGWGRRMQHVLEGNGSARSGAVVQEVM